MIGEMIRTLWCQAFHWSRHWMVDSGSYYRYGRKLYGSRYECRLCGREWIVEE